MRLREPVSCGAKERLVTFSTAGAAFLKGAPAFFLTNENIETSVSEVMSCAAMSVQSQVPWHDFL